MYSSISMSTSINTPFCSCSRVLFHEYEYEKMYSSISMSTSINTPFCSCSRVLFNEYEYEYYNSVAHKDGNFWHCVMSNKNYSQYQSSNAIIALRCHVIWPFLALLPQQLTSQRAGSGRPWPSNQQACCGSWAWPPWPGSAELTPSCVSSQPRPIQENQTMYNYIHPKQNKLMKKIKTTWYSNSFFFRLLIKKKIHSMYIISKWCWTNYTCICHITAR